MPVSVNEKALGDFIKGIDDPSMRRQLKAIATQKLLYKVYCNSKTCKGKLIFHIYQQGDQEVPEEQVPFTEYELRVRKRFDNEWGFKCGKCNNDSIMCEEEKGILPTSPIQNHPSLTPTVDDLNKIGERLKKRTKVYEEKDGKKNVDGFLLERMTHGL